MEESFAGKSESQQATALRIEATTILDRVGLRALLGRYGTVVVHGSYALDLMVWRDLDLYLIAPALQVDAFFELGGQLARLLPVHRMNFRDESDGSDHHLPAGLYWGLHLRDQPLGEWKIDIWAVTAAEASRLTEYEASVKRSLTPALRDAILSIKASVHSHKQYRKAFSAKDVYDAVIHASVRDVESFAAYIQEKAGIMIG